MSATVWTPGTKILLNANNLVFPQTFVMTVGQTIIDITEFSYTKNTNSIIVFKDGKLILNVEDYVESTETQIILLTPAAGGEEITILGFVGIEGTTSIADGRLSVSNTDLALGYLRDKLIAGNGVTLTRINVGLNEQLVIDVTFPVSILPDGSVPMDAPLILDDGSRAVSLAELDNVAGTVPKRQVILAAKNVNGLNSALKISSTALQVDLDASPTEPYILTYANGFNVRGQVNTIEEFKTNQLTILPTTVPTYSRSYLYKDYQGNFGHTKLQTHYGPSYDSRNSALLHFEGPNNSTDIIDGYGKTWTVTGTAKLTNTMYKFGSSSISLDGTANCGVRTTELKGVSLRQSWTISMWVRLNALPANAALATIANLGLSTTYGILLTVTTTSGTSKISLYMSSSGISWDIANGVLGTDTTWAVNVFRHVELTYNAQVGKYYVFVDGVKDIEVTSALEVITGDITSLGTSNTGTSRLNGYIDEFSYEPYCRHREDFTPPVLPYTADGYWFDTTNYLYKHIIAENTTVGGSPTFEVINRIELAEVTTDGTSITALNNYAILGEYTHVTPLISGSGVISFKHNLGVSVGQVEAELKGRNKIPVAGYMPGMETNMVSYGGSSLMFPAAPIILSSVSGEYKTGGAANYTYVQSRTTGLPMEVGANAATAARWDVVITVRRKF